MKFTMDEATKHRVVGIAVIISIAIVFIPAMIKKNNQRLEEKRIAVELPAKPPLPQTVEVDEPKVFAETKVAHVDLDTQKVLNDTEQQIKDHPIDEPVSIPKESHVSDSTGDAKIVSSENKEKTADKVAVLTPEKKPTLPKVVESKPIKQKVSKRSVKPVKQVVNSKKAKKIVKSNSHLNYAVQIGVFSETANAQALQKQLSGHGYDSRLVKTTIRGKPAVKVVIGRLASAEAANQLKNKLAKEQHIQGFVTKGVG